MTQALLVEAVAEAEEAAAVHKCGDFLAFFLMLLESLAVPGVAKILYLELKPPS